MELNQLIEYIQNPDKVLAVQDMEDMIDWATHWIYTTELELADLDFTLDVRLAELIETEGQVNKAEAKLKLLTPYIIRKKKEINLKAIKSYRQNIRRKRDRMLPR